MRESRSKDIGGRVFTVTQLPATRASKLFNRITRAIGPAMLEGLGNLNGAKIGDLSIAAVGPALSKLLDALSPEEQDSLTKALLEGSFVDFVDDNGKQIKTALLPVFDEIFAGRLEEIFVLCKFAYEANFGNFWKGLLAFAPSALGAVGAKSEESAT